MGSAPGRQSGAVSPLRGAGTDARRPLATDTESRQHFDRRRNLRSRHGAGWNDSDGSGISGRGPDTHDSGVTLSKLLPRIASYRDAFYKQHLARLDGPHGTRLREESTTLRQPFGGARQHLNARLARLRATQLQHVHLGTVLRPARICRGEQPVGAGLCPWHRRDCSVRSMAG